MIEQLFGSKTRVKLLKLFFSNPNRPFYVREITRKVEEQINSVRRELANMLSLGLITSDNSNNKLYYEVNQDYEHYDALQSMFADVKTAKEKADKPDTKETAKAAKKDSKDTGKKTAKELESKSSTQVELPEAQKWVKAGNIVGIAYSGVYTRDESSAVDILIIGDAVASKVDKVVAELEKEHTSALRYALIDAKEWQYRAQVRDKFWVQFKSAKKQIVLDKDNIFADR